MQVREHANCVAVLSSKAIMPVREVREHANCSAVLSSNIIKPVREVREHANCVAVLSSKAIRPVREVREHAKSALCSAVWSALCLLCVHALPIRTANTNILHILHIHASDTGTAYIYIYT